MHLPVRLTHFKTRRAVGRTGKKIGFVAGSSDGSVSVPASVGTAVPVDVNKKASALFQADAAEVLRVYQFFYKRKTTLKMIF